MSIIATHSSLKVLCLRVLLPVAAFCTALAFSYQYYPSYFNHNQNLKPNPQAARDFVRWWLKSALDYSPSTAASNHLKAAVWLDDGARSSFDETFWSKSKGVGKNIIFIPYYFWQPVEKQDGSIVIGVTGDFIAQSDPKLSSYSTKLNLTVHITSKGYRICDWKQPYCVDNSEAIKFLSAPSSFDALVSNPTSRSIPEANKRALSHFTSSMTHESQGNVKDAIAEYSKAVEANPNFALAVLSRGKMHNRRGEKHEALNDYSRAINLNSESPYPYFYRALVRRDLNNIKDAIEDNNRGLAFQPRQPYAHINRAMDRFSVGDAKGALEDTNEAINIEPSAVAYANRGLIRSWTGDLKGAIDDSNLAIKLDPHLAIAYECRGTARQHLNDKAGYEADYREAQRLQKEFPQ